MLPRLNIYCNCPKRQDYMVLHLHDASVDELKKKISDWSNIGKEDLRVLFAGKELEGVTKGKKQYLSDYNIIDRSQLFVVIRLPGGNGPETEQHQKQLDDAVELSDEPDIITWDDDPDNKRAKMPCGHAIGPESLTAYCRSLLSAGKFQFRCPHIDKVNSVYCGAQWEYFTIRRVAVLTDDEKKEFETKISQNYMRKSAGIQECPSCSVFCMRKNKTDRRIVCLSCSKDGAMYEFCWYCLGDWNTSGKSDCGNAACSGEDPRLRILKNAELKQIVGLPGCPSIRACPSCGMLIQHDRACKHMACICGQRFCFICLGVPNDAGRYSCGIYDTHCKIAPVQTVMSGEQQVNTQCIIL